MTHPEPGSNWKKWAVLLLLTVGVIISYIDRTNFSVVLAMRDFQNVFRTTDNERGLLNSAFFWTYTLMQIPAGLVVDRWGVKRPYAVGFFLWSAVSALTGWMQSIPQLLVARALLGVGESVVGPASIKYIHANYKERQRGLATGLYFSGTKIGLAIGAPLTVWLSQAWNWKGMFLILGVGCLLWLIPWMILVRDDRSSLPRQDHVAAPGVTLATLLSSPAMWGIFIGTFAYQYFVYFCMTWMPAYYVEQRHLSLNRMSVFQFFSFGGMAVMSVLAGWIADRIITAGAEPVRVRKAFTIAGLLIASTEVIGAQAQSDTVAIAFSVIALSGLGLMTANYWVLTQALVPGPAIGTAIGAQNFAASAAGIVAPLLTGWLKTASGGYSAPLNVIWVLLIAAAAAYLLLVRRSLAFAAEAEPVSSIP